MDRHGLQPCRIYARIDYALYYLNMLFDISALDEHSAYKILDHDYKSRPSVFKRIAKNNKSIRQFSTLPLSHPVKIP